MTAHCSFPRSKPMPSYYVVCCEYRTGREAVVDPELTRSDVIARIKSGEYQNIAFIHHIADGLAEIVTAELINAAELELKTEARDRADRIANERDHNFKLRVEA